MWSAVWGPVGEDGFFKPAFDKSTGKIDKDVVAHWRDHWDLLEYLKRNWSTVGPELKDNLYFFAGDADTYFLNNSSMELDAWLKTTTAPHSQAQFMYGNLKPQVRSHLRSASLRLPSIFSVINPKARILPGGTTASNVAVIPPSEGIKPARGQKPAPVRGIGGV